MKYNKFLRQANRHVSNRADGSTTDDTIVLLNADPNVDKGIDKTFGFTIVNQEAANLSMALVPANFDTERITVSEGVVNRTFDNITALNTAGYNVGAVLADGAVNATINGKTVHVTCASIDPTRTIKQFLDYIKFNPQRLKHLDIISNNSNAFDGNLSVTFCNPFYKNMQQDVQLSVFYSKYQYATDRIGIDFSDNELEFSDLLLLTCVIPASATMKFIMKFW